MGLVNSNTPGYLTVDTSGYMFGGMNTSTLAERLKIAMEAGDISQTSLAEKAGIAQPTIWKIVTGKTQSSAKIVEISTVLGVRPEWLAKGIGPMRDGDSDNGNAITTYDKEAIPGLFIVNLWDDNGETKDVVAVPDTIKSPNCRAYKLRYDSGYPEAPDGAIIVVDTLETPGHNDFVYAKVKDQASVYKFTTGGENGFLISSEPRVPLIPVGDDAKIIGVVVYLSRSFKR
ncbi:helix-turn-helix domain-containing protein [Serratia sp. JSRIV004]|uniref:helix-turn-helix domain-containing protein n=1 Tax=Serratia sp. JSRIV004 TaxID=2831895 RepID=UPI001CC15317|nr:helix-turn-helix domain-containing protein [Serratia sp. JSRIV004]UAN59615.1 LexA family transcriptional regulator [Serratia sp. JSRIV004]